MLISLTSYLRASTARMVGRLRRAPEAEEGAAAMEFGLIMPVFIAIFFGVTEISAMNLHARRAQQSVDFAAEYLSRDNDNILSNEERTVAEDIWQIVNVTSFNSTGGDAYTNSRGKYARSFAAAEFVPDPAGCGTVTGGESSIPGNGRGLGAERGNGEKNGHVEGAVKGLDCPLVPRLDWSFLATQGITNPKRRSCEQRLVKNEEAADETSLPQGMVGRGAIVIADFTYKYEPFFEVGFIPRQEKHITAIRMSRSGMLLRNELKTGHMVYCDTSTGGVTS